MHQYWEHSIAQVTGSCLRVVTSAYRPLGGLYYFVLYRVFGFNPLPFRAVALALMLANVYLALVLLRRLSGSLLAALVGAVLMVNHPITLELLYSSGTIYDILCFLFYLLAVLCYFSWRDAAQRAGSATLSWPRIAAIVALTGAALDAKETAMMLPAVLWLIEVVYFPPPKWTGRECLRFLWRQGRGAAIAAALVVPTIAIKVLTPNPLSNDPRYAAHTFLGTLKAYRGYQNFLLYGNLGQGELTFLRVLALWIAMYLAAVLLRSRAMQFGLGFLLVSMLPVCLIQPRNGYMIYIPLFGWALYCGAFFERSCDWLARRTRLRPRAQAVATLTAAVLLLAPLIKLHAETVWRRAAWIRIEHRDMDRFVALLRTQHPQLPPGSSLLLIDDPLPASYYLLFMAQLSYADPTLQLDRIKMMTNSPAGDELTGYDYLLAGRWQLHDVRGIRDPRPPVEVRLDGSAVVIPEFAGQTVDLVIRITAPPHRVVVRGVRLDSSGCAQLAEPVPPDSPARIAWVRPAGGDWMSAQPQ